MEDTPGIRGVLLDVDGTLLLSNDAHARAWVDALAESGYDVPLDRIQPLIGMGGDKLLGQLIPGLSTKAGIGEQVAQRRQHILQNRYAAGLRPAPGSRELLKRMLADGLHLVVASSSKRDELDMLLKAAGIADLIKRSVTSTDVEQAKPAPDVVHAALDKIKLPAAEVLMLGDTPFDIESASRAGVGVIAVRTGGHSDRDLSGAVAIYDDPAALLHGYDSSPLAGRITP